MGINYNYFKTLNGGLKPSQLIFNVIIFIILAISTFPRGLAHLAQPLLQLSITNTIIGIIILILRVVQNNRNVNSVLGKLEFGIYIVSTYLYISFANLLVPIGWLELNIAMVLGYILSMLYATDAFDKFVHFMRRDNEVTYHQRFPLPSQINPPPIYPQGFSANKH